MITELVYVHVHIHSFSNYVCVSVSVWALSSLRQCAVNISQTVSSITLGVSRAPKVLLSDWPASISVPLVMKHY